jgi:WD40 repeat protein
VQVHEEVFIELLKGSVKRNGYITKHVESADCVAFHPNHNNNHLAASAGKDKKIKIFNTETGAMRKILITNHGDIQEISFSPGEGKSMAVCFEYRGSGMIAVYDVEAGEEMCTMRKQEPVRSISYSPDGKMLASGGWDKALRIWDVATGKEAMVSMKGHTKIIQSVVFSPDGKLVASGSVDHTVRIWSMETGKRALDPLRAHKDTVRSVVFSPDSKLLASASLDETLRIWDVSTGKEARTVFKGQSGMLAVTFSPDGRFVASGSHEVQIWDITADKEALDTQEYISSDEEECWQLEEDWQYKKINDPRLKCTLRGQSDLVFSVVFSPDGRLVASACRDCTVRIWDFAADKGALEPLKKHSDKVLSVVFSPDAKLLASGSSDKTIRIWDVQIRTMALGPLTLHTGAVRSVVFSPSGRLLASGSSDGSVIIWDMATGNKAMEPLRGHSKDVNIVVFSPNGKLLASGSRDETVRIWDVATGKEAAQHLVHSDDVKSVGFTTDSKCIAAMTWNNTFRIWDIATGKETIEPLNTLPSSSGSPQELSEEVMAEIEAMLPPITLSSRKSTPEGKLWDDMGSENHMMSPTSASSSSSTCTSDQKLLSRKSQDEAFGTSDLEDSVISWTGVDPDVAEIGKRVEDLIEKRCRTKHFIIEARSDMVRILSPSGGSDKVWGQYKAPAVVSCIACTNEHVCLGLPAGKVRVLVTFANCLMHILIVLHH